MFNPIAHLPVFLGCCGPNASSNKQSVLFLSDGVVLGTGALPAPGRVAVAAARHVWCDVLPGQGTAKAWGLGTVLAG